MVENRPDFRKALDQVRVRISIAQSRQPTKQEAQAILSALRVGVPPQRGVLAISVNREREFQAILADIEEVASGKSKLLFINGLYGAGKSHLLYVLKEFALSKNLAVSLVSLTHGECPLHDLLTVYQRLVQSLEVPEAPKGQAVEAILARWATSLHAHARGSTDAARASIRRLPGEFQAVLATFYSATQTHDYALRSLALSWLRGELRSPRQARRLGVAVVPTNDNALWMLGNLARMIRFLTLSGLVILLDEAESMASVRRLPQREAGYRNLRSLMESGRTPFCYFVYATTPDFMEHSVEFLGALTQKPRVLEIASLRRDDLIELGLVIRDLHLQSYTWANVSRIKGSRWLGFLRKLLGGSWEQLTNRDFVRSIVAALDVCQCDPDLAPETTLSGL